MGLQVVVSIRLWLCVMVSCLFPRLSRPCMGVCADLRLHRKSQLNFDSTKRPELFAKFQIFCKISYMDTTNGSLEGKSQLFGIVPEI